MMELLATMTAYPIQRARLISVDVLRGLTIALMILVNDPGDWGHVYPQLDHATWNGFTLTDFVFPNFLFLAGVAIVLSLRARIARRETGSLDRSTRITLAAHMVRRAVLLVVTKLFLSAFPHFHVGHLRLFGVLTRIAVCYLSAGLLCLGVWNVRRRLEILVLVAALLLVGYWVLLRFVPVPGSGVPTHAMAILDPERNLAAWMDRGFNAWTQRWLHTGSLYNKTHDPEGLLSTLPAIATTLLGCVTGLALTEGAKAHTAKLRGFLVCGALLLATGLLWGRRFPINKNLWTSSYVLFAGGWSLLLLALCYWLYDVRRLNETRVGRMLTLPWLVFGSNAITAFVLSNFLVEVLIAIHIGNPAGSARRISLSAWPYTHVFAAHGSTENTSLAFAIAFTALCFLPIYGLWRRKIFLKL